MTRSTVTLNLFYLLHTANPKIKKIHSHTLPHHSPQFFPAFSFQVQGKKFTLDLLLQSCKKYGFNSIDTILASRFGRDALCKMGRL